MYRKYIAILYFSPLSLTTAVVHFWQSFSSENTLASWLANGLNSAATIMDLDNSLMFIEDRLTILEGTMQATSFSKTLGKTSS